MTEQIEFSNIHGTFVLEVGKTYDFDMVDEDGDVYPKSEIEVLGQTGELISVRYDSGNVFYIEKVSIAHTTKNEE